MIICCTVQHNFAPIVKAHELLNKIFFSDKNNFKFATFIVPEKKIY